jgi:hypothetical protein
VAKQLSKRLKLSFGSRFKLASRCLISCFHTGLFDSAANFRFWIADFGFENAKAAFNPKSK